MPFTLSKRVAADLFEGEYIIANLETGLYYSLQGTGIYLLNNLPIENQLSLVESITAKFPTQKEEITNDLNAIWQLLLQEGIIQKELTAIAKNEFELPEAFEPSAFNSYADMQDLLALDPIHEVGEQGWEQETKK